MLRSQSRHKDGTWLACIAIAALGVSFACSFGPAVPLLMLLSVAAPLWLALAIVAIAVLWFIRRGRAQKWLLAIATLAALAMAALVITGSRNWQGRTSMAHGPMRGDIRIVEFNAWTENRDPAGATQWILAQRPDVVVLIESAGRADAIANGLARALPYRTSCRGDRRCSTLILSHMRPQQSRGLARGDADNRRALSAALVRFGSPETPFAVLAVHLSRPLPMASQARELDELSQAMVGESTDRLVVTGDFNAPGWSMTMRQLARRLGVAPLVSAPSWPAPAAHLGIPALLAIDHSLLGPGWAAARIERGPAIGSDHYPFTLTISPRDARPQS